MSISRVAVISFLLLITLTTHIQAQTQSSVTGAITPQGTVRMIAHGEALQIRMEIYSASGEVVSDSGLRQGSIVDCRFRQQRQVGWSIYQWSLRPGQLQH